MACTCAPSLIKLRNEFNYLWPGRDKASDGCCGDPAHQARKSDHNADGTGYAHAYDVDEDLGPGEHSLNWLWDAWRFAPDPRLKYLIYERKIWFASSGQTKIYTGENAHSLHMHVSIQSWAHNDVSDWLPRVFGLAGTPEEPDKLEPVVANPPAPVRPDMPYILDTPEGTGTWIAFSDGAVWTGGQAQYFGGANNEYLPDGTFVGKMQDTDEITDIVPAIDGGYGYTLLSIQSPTIGFTYKGLPRSVADPCAEMRALVHDREARLNRIRQEAQFP